MLRAEGLHRPLPRPARPVHGEARRLQAYAFGRRLLERRRAESDAAAHLRRRVPDAEGSRRAPPAPRSGEGPRSPQARQGARAFRLPSLRARLAVLPAEGCDGLQPPPRLHARPVREVRLPGGHHAAGLRLRALQDLRALRELQREHVLHGDRRARVRREAHELPGPLPSLRLAGLQLPRSPGPIRGFRAPPPLRAVGCHAGPDTRPHVRAGRRAPLLRARPDARRDGPLPRLHPGGLRDVRIHGSEGRPRHAPREVHGSGRELGQGRKGAPAGLREARGRHARLDVLPERG